MEARLEALEARVSRVERSTRRNGLRLKEAIAALELARTEYRQDFQRLRELVEILSQVRVARSAPPG